MRHGLVRFHNSLYQMHLPDPKFPPLLKGHAVKAPLTPGGEACRRAAAGELGAGDLVWSRNTAKAECALVLEPEIPLTRACQMAALGMVAVNETLGFLCPPQMPVLFQWPGTLLIDGAAAGEVRLLAPSTSSGHPPQWLVLSVSLTLATPQQKGEPGEHLGQTSLFEEGAGDVTRTAVIEALATRLLAWLNTWDADGFRPIHEQWLYRAAGYDEDVTFHGRRGRVLGLDEEGSLLFKPTDGKAIVFEYLPHVLAPS